VKTQHRDKKYTSENEWQLRLEKNERKKGAGLKCKG